MMNALSSVNPARVARLETLSHNLMMEHAEIRKKRARSIIKILKKTYPDVRLALDFTTPLELLIALILAAQCTDERVNRVMPQLFRKYRSAKDWVDVDRAVLEEEIHTTGF